MGDVHMTHLDFSHTQPIAASTVERALRRYRQEALAMAAGLTLGAVLILGLAGLFMRALA